MNALFGRAVLIAIIAAPAFAPAAAQDVPMIDTEDATLGSADIRSVGRLHPQVALDLRNGDFARGTYDDDRADLGRLPIHAQIGVAIALNGNAADPADSWLVLRSSNGFHAPDAGETTAPRSWYESNTLAALVLTPSRGLRTAAVYTIKTSPNGVSAATHEASLSIAYAGDDGIGTLSPTFAATIRPKGGHGLFTQLGFEPGFDLSQRDDATRFSVPIVAGIGWHGFYGAGSRNRTYASAGAALEHPFTVGATRWSARAEALAVIRDARLAALSGPDGETARVVPLVTISVAVAY
ncbi:MAG TPA: hypothetical protein VF649_04985 [Sphingomonas sp.]|jgi:hypothetical protein|uniref:hypothetical protein n=1 Tax=Sphingomonas sp. TaxID=28214 RepID=UPI002ED9989F